MWLYDPRTNILKEMTLQKISDVCGTGYSNISRLTSRGSRIQQINCYSFKEKPTLAARRILYEAEVIEGEIWKRYKETCYEVSNYGRVRRFYKTTMRFVLPCIKQKHMLIKLNINGTSRRYRLRDVVAEVFLKQEANKTCLVHKNGNHADCSVWNIERANRSEIARKTGGKAKSKAVVLIDEHTKVIINWWPSARKTAPDNFMSYQAVNDRCNGKVASKKEGWFMWEVDYDEEYGAFEDLEAI